MCSFVYAFYFIGHIRHKIVRGGGGMSHFEVEKVITSFSENILGWKVIDILDDILHQGVAVLFIINVR